MSYSSNVSYGHLFISPVWARRFPFYSSSYALLHLLLANRNPYILVHSLLTSLLHSLKYFLPFWHRMLKVCTVFSLTQLRQPTFPERGFFLLKNCTQKQQLGIASLVLVSLSSHVLIEHTHAVQHVTCVCLPSSASSSTFVQKFFVC